MQGWFIKMIQGSCLIDTKVSDGQILNKIMHRLSGLATQDGVTMEAGEKTV